MLWNNFHTRGKSPQYHTCTTLMQNCLSTLKQVVYSTFFFPPYDCLLNISFARKWVAIPLHLTQGHQKQVTIAKHVKRWMRKWHEIMIVQEIIEFGDRPYIVEGKIGCLIKSITYKYTCWNELMELENIYVYNYFFSTRPVFDIFFVKLTSSSSMKILHPGLYIMFHDQGYVDFSSSQSLDYWPW